MMSKILAIFCITFVVGVLAGKDGISEEQMKMIKKIHEECEKQFAPLNEKEPTVKNDGCYYNCLMEKTGMMTKEGEMNYFPEMKIDEKPELKECIEDISVTDKCEKAFEIKKCADEFGD